MSCFDPDAYGPALAALLGGERLNPLGPGEPDLALRDALRSLSMEEAVRPHTISDTVMADACRAGLWLRHNFLDESHEISQQLATPTGSYWHALMHRREPDHANAAYWLRRVGSHPIFAELARAAAELGYPETGTRWDPFAFNDRCEQHRGTGDETEELLRRVQQAEWELLFAYCFRQATSARPFSSQQPG